LTNSDQPVVDNQTPTHAAASNLTTDALPYVVPMFAYVAWGGIDSLIPTVDGHANPVWYPISYALRVLIVSALVIFYRRAWNDFLPLPSWRSLLLGFTTGAIVFGLWIELDGWYGPLPFTGHREAFDPNQIPGAWRWPFIGVRMLGLVLLVPVVEELFWRSFVMRWVIDQDFHRLPVGTVTLTASAITSVLFALAHPEWLPALLTGLLWAWLLWSTKSLAACLVSHAIANLILGIYVVLTGDWRFW
jgi:CAAX prenyl protease-like protein